MKMIMNSEKVEQFIDILFGNVAKKTSNNFAVIILYNIQKRLLSRYEFLKYIKIDDTSFSKGFDAIRIQQDINFTDPKTLDKALNDILIESLKCLDKRADYFFKRDLKKKIKKINPSLLNNIKLDFDEMLINLINKPLDDTLTYNEEFSKLLIIKIIMILNKKLPEKKAIETIIETKKNLTNKYYFFDLININKVFDKGGFYSISIKNDVRGFWTGDLGAGFMELINEIMRKVGWNEEFSIFDLLREELTNEQIEFLESLEFKFNQKNNYAGQINNDKLLKNSISAIEKIIAEKTSQSYAKLTIGEILKMMSYKHDSFNYIYDMNDFSFNSDECFEISEKINNVDIYDIVESIKDMILIIIGNNENDEVHSFLENFKINIGEKISCELEKNGLDFSLLEKKLIEKEVVI